MRFMVIVKATKDSEAGKMPTTEMISEMGKFNEELVKAGMMEAGEGLHASSKGARIAFTASGPRVTEGPFTPIEDVASGFWIIKAKSKDDALDWMKRAPFEPGNTIEIRPILSAEDFGDAFTPELKAKEEKLRTEAAKGQ